MYLHIGIATRYELAMYLLLVPLLSLRRYRMHGSNPPESRSGTGNRPHPHAAIRDLYIVIGVLTVLGWLGLFSYRGPVHSSFSSSNSASVSSLKFDGFNDELIPPNSEVDVNIGTNYSPFGPMDGRHRILVDPLFGVCDSNAKLTSGVTAFCFAVSNFTGFATFNEYNRNQGVSSSLAEVSPGTSHANFPILSKRTVLVLEAAVLFKAILLKNTKVYRLKLDLQGFELTVLRNIQSLLRDSNFVVHIKAECFCPKGDGVQIYQVDNACDTIAEVLQDAGYETMGGCSRGEWSDVIGYKKGMATDFIPDAEFD